MNERMGGIEDGVKSEILRYRTLHTTTVLKTTRKKKKRGGERKCHSADVRTCWIAGGWTDWA